MGHRGIGPAFPLVPPALPEDAMMWWLINFLGPNSPLGALPAGLICGGLLFIIIASLGALFGIIFGG